MSPSATPRPPSLGELCAGIAGARFVCSSTGAALGPTGAPAPNVRALSLSSDARTVEPGALYFAVPGEAFGGIEHAALAAARGAVAVVAEREPEAALGVPLLVVPDVRAAKASAAALFYGDPSHRLAVVGITGTNGKTTTSFMLRAILEAAGRRVGLLGTVGWDTGGGMEPPQGTTPGPIGIQRAFAAMLEHGCDAAVVEVSSHALDQGRVDAVRFRAGVFTNLGSDHLDYHGTRAAYLDAKARLFEGLVSDSLAVLNADDPASAELARRTRARVRSYGSRDDCGDVRAERVRLDAEGARFAVVSPGARFEVQTPCLGAHNVSNALAAAATALALDVPSAAVESALAKLPPVPGRLEPIERGQPFRVFVDYAHDDAALAAALGAVRALARGRVFLVFGGHGDRDRGKRPRMGQVASRLADAVFLTTSDPGPEAPEIIARAIRAGMDGGAKLVEIADRREALASAIAQARAGDVVLVTGRGSDPEQLLRGGQVPFDDRRVVAELLEARRPAV